MTSIALCMIVRDEALVIERCLASVAGVIDSWVICDTGSSDDTVARIEAALGHLPGIVHHHEWRDFGHNRSELMRVAAGAADYLLLLDADMTLRVDQPLPLLDADAYLIRHEGDPEYVIPRLVRGDRTWWYSHPTHEYLATEGEFRQELLSGVVVEHHADGSSRTVKLERDRDLLERYLIDHPKDARATFYLAQTYAESGEQERAIELYAERAELGAWHEEAWYARYRQGALLVDRDWDAAVEVLLDAWKRLPTRAEPLLELARGYRFREEYQLAHRYASEGRKIARPEIGLFLQPDAYDWSLEFEYSISSYWIGEYQESLESCQRLLDERDVPLWIAPYVHMNLDHARRGLGLEPLQEDENAYVELEIVEPFLAALIPGMRIAELKLELRPYWPQTNPTIAADGDGFRAVVRSVNYLQKDGSRYTFLERDGIVRTVNYLVRLDADLKLVDARRIDASGLSLVRFASQVQGFEDMRLIRVGDTWMATATVREYNDAELCEVALLTLDDAAVTSVQVLTSLRDGWHEKNWMPFVSDGQLHVVFTCGPTVVARPTTDGRLEQVSSHPAPVIAAGFRGGSQGVPFDDGHLFLVHEVDQIGWSRVYTHRFIFLDASFRLSAWSEPFRLVGDTVEFCAGLERMGSDLVMSFGVADQRAFLAVVDEAAVRDLLTPVDALSVREA